MLLEQRNHELERKLVNSTSTTNVSAAATTTTAALNTSTSSSNNVSSSSPSRDNSMLQLNDSTVASEPSQIVAAPQLPFAAAATTPLSTIPNINQGGYIITAQGTLYVPPMGTAPVASSGTTTTTTAATTGDILVDQAFGHLLNHSTPTVVNKTTAATAVTSQTSPAKVPLIGCLSPSAKVPTGMFYYCLTINSRLDNYFTTFI